MEKRAIIFEKAKPGLGRGHSFFWVGREGKFVFTVQYWKQFHLPLYESFVYVLIRPFDFCSLPIALGIKHNTLLVNNSINKPVANRLFGENSFLVETLGYPWKTFGGNYDIVEFFFIGNWFSCLETEINSFSQSGPNLFMIKPINNLIVLVRLKFFQNVSYLTLPPNGSLVLRKILCIHLRQKLVWQTCFSARSVCRKLSYEGYDGQKKQTNARKYNSPHLS